MIQIGEISFDELYEALKKGQPNMQFDKKTVQLLLSQFDKNNDNDIIDTNTIDTNVGTVTTFLNMEEEGQARAKVAINERRKSIADQIKVEASNPLHLAEMMKYLIFFTYYLFYFNF